MGFSTPYDAVVQGRAVRSTGLIKPTSRAWIAYGRFAHEIPPRPIYPTNPDFFPRPTYPINLVGEMPIRSKFGAGLESGCIKPAVRTDGPPNMRRLQPNTSQCIPLSQRIVCKASDPVRRGRDWGEGVGRRWRGGKSSDGGGGEEMH
jgi:hypothetical protein